ncbi:GNAT family N-acetyltransferase [Kitasatospora sp. NPDC004272]
MTIRHPGLGVRPLRAEEWDTWYRTLEVAFGGDQEPAQERELWRRLIGVERTPALWSNGQLVGGGGSFDFRLVVPGGAVVPAAGLGGRPGAGRAVRAGRLLAAAVRAGRGPGER